MKLSNWGGYPEVEAKVLDFADVEELRRIFADEEFLVPRGNGRCYGDAALAPAVVSVLRYNRILDFDPREGIVRAQAGALAADLLERVIPAGWFLAVTPGTQFVTVGGCIASDVHGKNQHRDGSFSAHVLEIELMDERGEIRRCSRATDAELFWATCGGMGLTGVILSATLRLKKIETTFIRQEVVRSPDLDGLLRLFEESSTWTYSVAWTDAPRRSPEYCRGVFFRGEHAGLSELGGRTARRAVLETSRPPKFNVPFHLPSFVLNRLSTAVFNEYFFRKAPSRFRSSLVRYDAFFYPMDGILNWNRIYGKRGFVEYQFVLPQAASRDGLRQILETTRRSGLKPYFSGLKLFGGGPGFISFPMAGPSMALDFPATKEVFGLLDRLDDVVSAHGGRIYLTKDARMSSDVFLRTYENARAFSRLVRALNPARRIRSLQSERLGVTVP